MTAQKDTKDFEDHILNLAVLSKGKVMSVNESIELMKSNDKFVQTYTDAKGLTEQKRAYMSDYGYDNVKEYMNMETNELRRKDNYDRYSFDDIVKWWRNKASKRYDTLQSDGRLRNDLEVWNTNENIDIIR